MKKLTNEEFINKSILIHKDHYNYSLVEYIKNKSKVKLICNIHNNIFEITPNMHLDGQGCKLCKNETLSKLKKFSIEQILLKFKEIHNNKYNYSLIEYVGYDMYVKIICNIHGIFEKTPHLHIMGQGCPSCSKEKDSLNRRKNITEFINESNIIHNNKYDYSKVIYVNNKSKIIVICKIHGEFLTTLSLHLYQKCGCTKCNSSLGEERIIQYLNNKNIEYSYQHRFKNCKYKNTLPFDFYLPDYKICIEYDGLQHFKETLFFGDFKLQKEKDNIKSKFCIDNNIALLRIPYYEYDNILLICNNFINNSIL